VTDPDGCPAPALSPSRAADFRTCPLLYRFRAVDRLPEAPSPAALRGTLVHAVLERVFDLPAADRVPVAARDLLAPAWAAVRDAEPLAGEPADAPGWWASVGALLDRWFTLEDPRVLEPAGRELRVAAELPAPDRPGAAQGGRRPARRRRGRAHRRRRLQDRVGPAGPGEARALFGVTFYALVLLLRDGRAPDELRPAAPGRRRGLDLPPRRRRAGALRPHPGRGVGRRSAPPPPPATSGRAPGGRATGARTVRCARLGRHAAALPGVAGRRGA
jgi:putative RecB family exonuclease